VQSALNCHPVGSGNISARNCVFSFEAVATLRAQGFEARRLQDGFPEWRVAGMPVETDPASHSGM